MSRKKVQEVLDLYPSLTLVEYHKDNDDALLARRKQFLPDIIIALGKGEYGFLIKSAGKIQDDVVCKPDRIHFDCMTAVEEVVKGVKYWRIKAAWSNQGLIQPRWKFGRLEDHINEIEPLEEAEPKPEPKPVPSNNSSVEERLAKIDKWIKSYGSIT